MQKRQAEPETRVSANMDVGQKGVRKVDRDVWEQLGNMLEGTEEETSE